MDIYGLLSITTAFILGFPVAPPAFAQSEERVKFAANIEFIKGHLEQAVTNKQAGKNELAAARDGHTIAEIYSLVKREIEDQDEALATQLEKFPIDFANQINTMTPEEVQAKVLDIYKMLDKERAEQRNQ